jgi:hypothetical protein
MGLTPEQQKDVYGQLARTYDSIADAAKSYFSDLPPVTRRTITCAVGDAQLTIFAWANEVDKGYVHLAFAALAAQIKNESKTVGTSDFRSISELSASVKRAGETAEQEARNQKDKGKNGKGWVARILHVIDRIVQGASDAPPRRSDQP